MNKYIAIALFFAATSAIAGEVGRTSSGNVSNNQAYDKSNDGGVNAPTAADAGGDGAVPMDTTSQDMNQDMSQNTNQDTTQDMAQVTDASANADTASADDMAPADTSDAMDVAGGKGPMLMDAGVSPKSSATYKDQGYVAMPTPSNASNATSDASTSNANSNNDAIVPGSAGGSSDGFKDDASGITIRDAVKYIASRGQWNVGFAVGGAGAAIPVNETLISASGRQDPQKYRFNLTGEGVSGGLTAAYAIRRGQMSYGMGVAGYLDTYQEWNRDHKINMYDNTITGTSATYFKRTYTLEFAPRIGRYINDLHIYGKLGVICSAFQYKFKDDNSNVDIKKNITAWGGVAGVGIQKPIGLPALGTVNVGLEYDYHLYESLTPVVNYGTYTDTAKLRPRYHNAYLTLSKSF